MRLMRKLKVRVVLISLDFKTGKKARLLWAERHGALSVQPSVPSSEGRCDAHRLQWLQSSGGPDSSCLAPVNLLGALAIYSSLQAQLSKPRNLRQGSHT